MGPLPLRRLPALALAALLAGCGGAAGPGTLHGVVEIQEVLVASKVGGRVAETPAAEGARLRAGDVVARFEAPESEARRAAAAARLAEARAVHERAVNGPRREERAAAAAAVEAARARLSLLEAGPRKEEIDAAKAELDAAEADLAFQEEDFSRNERLAADRTISRNELDASRSRRDRARGRRDAAKAAADMMVAGTRKEEIDAARAEVRRLEAEAALLEAGTRPEEVAAAAARVAEAEAALRAAEADLAEAVVRAPEDAILEVLAVRKGDVLAPGAPVARLLRAGDLWVKVFVPETELGRVTLGQKAEVTVDSFPDRRFAGTVTWIAAQAEFTPRNVQSADERRHQVFAVKVVVDDPGGVFHSGMAAEVTLAGAAE
jgi:multidrug resistance efflux pump